MKLNKLTRKQALEAAKQATSITMTDTDLDMRNVPVTFDRMMSEIDQFGRHLKATQYEGQPTISIDFAGIHFEIA